MAKKITKKEFKKLCKKVKYLRKQNDMLSLRNSMEQIKFNSTYGAVANPNLPNSIPNESQPKPSIPCIWPEVFLHGATDDWETVSFLMDLRDYTGMSVKKGVKVVPEGKNKCTFEIVGMEADRFDDACALDTNDSIVVILERVIRTIINEYVDTSYFNICGERCFEIRKLKMFNKLFEHAEFINSPITVDDIVDKSDQYASKAVCLIAPPSVEVEEKCKREMDPTKYYLYDFQVIKTKPLDILLEGVDDPDDDIFTDNSDVEEIEEFVNEDCGPSDDEEYYPEGDELFDEDIAKDESVKETNIPEEEASNDH